MKQYKKYSTNNTKQSKYKYTYYQNTHTLQNPHIHKPTPTQTHTYTNLTHIQTPHIHKTHTYTNPHIHKPTHTQTHTYTHMLQNKLQQTHLKLQQTQFLYSSLHTLFLVCILHLHALIVCMSSPFLFCTLCSPCFRMSSPVSCLFSVFVFLSCAFYVFSFSGVFLFSFT